jgi:threonine/homoserine/homoserine lactone efflux protein
VDPLLIAYVTFTAVLVITPGSTTAVIVRNTLMGGRAAGLGAAAGAALGNTSHAAAAGLGLAILFARWPVAMTALRVSGAIFLAWLGGVSLYRTARFRDGGMPLLTEGDGERPRTTGFRQGLAVNLLNPAIATFYLVVVPSFLPPGSPRWYFAVLAAIHVTLAFVCHGVWALALDRLRRFFRPPMARRLLGAATGFALLALAARVLVTA